jgi:hypothetical protein
VGKKQGRGRSSRVGPTRKRGAHGPAAGSAANGLIQKLSNRFELIQSKDDVPVIQNVQIKYGFEDF